MTVKDRVAIVTGGAKGNGKGIVEELASQGAKVAILGHPDKLEETVKEMTSKGYEVIGFVVDVCDKEKIKECVEAIYSKYGRIEILVNNAGILRCEPFIEVSDDSINEQFEVNIKGCWNVTQSVVPYMIRAKYGRIINMSSVTGEYVCDPGSVGYATTKAALIGFTKGLAVEYAGIGITSNALCPGWIRTPMVENIAREERPEDPESFLALLAEGMPVKRLGIPKDIGCLVAFLASDEAEFITGASVVIDGGSILPES